MKTVFLLGAIGAGKSTALEMFRAKGAIVLSADSVVHDLYQNDAELIAQIEAQFGPVLTDSGSVDRKALSQYLLMNPHAILKLEEIVHPKVRERLSKIIDESTGEIFVYELPISRPTTDFTLADVIVVIDAAEDVRHERITARGFASEEALQRIKLHPKPFVPDHKPVFTLKNDGDKTNLETQVNNIWKAIVSG